MATHHGEHDRGACKRANARLDFLDNVNMQAPSWLVNDSVPHSYSCTPDTAKALLTLAESSSAWNQTWHLPTTPNSLMGKQFIALAAKEFSVPPRYRVLSRPMIKIFGWFNSDIGESYEMLYQSDSPYLFESSKFARAFGVAGTPYADGIRLTAAWYKKPAAA